MSKNHQLPKTISIIGLYKSGTSWLLSVLCRHPDIIGIRELDMVRAILGNPNEPPILSARSERISMFFHKTPWCRVPQDLLEKTDRLTALEAIDIWADSLRKNWSTSETHTSYSEYNSSPKTFFDLDRKIAAHFLEHVKSASCPETLANQFLDTIRSYASNARYSLMKAADQIAVFDRLKKLIPDCKCILIIRDGRDAAISAFHYRQLMKQENAPWLKNTQDMQSLFKGWISRAEMTRKLLDAGENIYVLRYEDLSNNFHQELYKLLTWLELDASDTLIDEINSLTSFEKLTGRKRGTESKSIIRKGATREWIEVYSAEEKKQAWNMGGDLLSYFGYSEDGNIYNWKR